MRLTLDVQEIYNDLLEQRARLQEFFDSVPDESKYSNAVTFKGTIGSLSDECRKCKRSIYALDECLRKFRDYWRKELNDAGKTRASANSTVMTLTEAAAFLNVCRQTLARRARAGDVPCVIVGRQYRFLKSALIGAQSNGLKLTGAPQ